MALRWYLLVFVILNINDEYSMKWQNARHEAGVSFKGMNGTLDIE